MMTESSKHKTDCLYFEWKYVNYTDPLFNVSKYWNAGTKLFIAQCKRAEVKDWFLRPVLYPCEECPFYDAAPYAASRFSMLDDSFREIEDLTIDDLTLEEREKVATEEYSGNYRTIRILTFTDYGTDRNRAIACLCLDVSNSMGDNLPIVSAAATAWLDSMLGLTDGNPNPDLVSIVGYDATPEYLLLMSSDPTAITDAIETLAIGGSESATYDAVLSAVEYTRDHAATGGKAVLLISDGADDTSTATAQEVIDAAIAGGVTIHTIGLYSNDFDATELERMAADTGGTYTYVSAISDIAHVSSVILNTVHGGRYGLLWRSGVAQNVDGVCRMTDQSGNSTEQNFRSVKTSFGYSVAPEKDPPTHL